MLNLKAQQRFATPTNNQSILTVHQLLLIAFNQKITKNQLTPIEYYKTNRKACAIKMRT